MSRFVISGTGTGIGKTVFAAALTAAMDAYYWKPVQAGRDGETDSQTVARLGNIPDAQIVPEAYNLRLAASPHLSASREGVTIDQSSLVPPPHRKLVIEGAGGVMVPLSPMLLTVDLFAQWQLPVILVTTTQLGTISHTLTAIESLKARDVPIHGLAFVGDPHADNEAIIPELSGVRRLGRLPGLYPLEPQALSAAFKRNFDLADYL
jgi:dethiobiotin synthetase